jgi:hypothetical protein
MINQGDIKEHMNVIGQDGIVIGMVDKLEGGTQTIKLARDMDEHVHHWIPLGWVKKVDAKGVHITKDALTTQASWQSSPPTPIATHPR